MTTLALTGSSGRSASFSWSADQAGSRFACSLDGGAFAACSSPRTYRGLALGGHVLRVHAINFAGDFSDDVLVPFTI